MKKKYIVALNDEERAELQRVVYRFGLSFSVDPVPNTPDHEVNRGMEWEKIQWRQYKAEHRIGAAGQASGDYAQIGCQRSGMDGCKNRVSLRLSYPGSRRRSASVVEKGFRRTLEGDPKQPRGRGLDGEQEAKIIALRLGEPPAGHTAWTLRLVAEKAVELHIVEKVSYQTIRTVLKKRI